MVTTVRLNVSKKFTQRISESVIIIGNHCILEEAWTISKGIGKEGWEGDARGRRYGDICICITDSLGYTAETNTPL